jgi:hypothetical protein
MDRLMEKDQVDAAFEKDIEKIVAARCVCASHEFN